MPIPPPRWALHTHTQVLGPSNPTRNRHMQGPWGAPAISTSPALKHQVAAVPVSAGLRHEPEWVEGKDLADGEGSV